MENNMKRITKTARTLGLIGFVVMGSAYAEDDRYWYAGANIGQARAKIDDARITSQLLAGGLATTSITDQDSKTGFKLFGGYQLNKRLALEAGYFDLGQFGYSAVTVPAGTLSGNIKLNGWNLDLVGLLPINERFSAFGRLGVNYAQAKDTFTATGGVNPPANSSPSHNSTHYKMGLGLQYDLNPDLGLRLEGERYRVDDAVGNLGDINMLSLGVVYRFGRTKPAAIVAAAPVMVAAEPILVIVPVMVKTQQYCSILDFQFEIKQDDIQREEKEKFAVLGTYMKKYPETTVVIEGHTDNVGEPEYNQKLSQRRAESVVSYLIDNLKIPASRLTAVGYGATRPIADNDTVDGRQANRRIDAVIACVTDVEGLKVAAARVTMAMEMEFDPYKSNIDPKYADQLERVAAFMKATPTLTATVEGHAGSSVGVGAERERVSPELAMEISSRRAQNVVNYLVDTLGISRTRLGVAAFGQTRRVSYGTTLESQKENRRVNIIFNYAGK